MIPQFKCPECNTTEIYRIGRLVIPEPGGKETVYIDYSFAHEPEPGKYKCVDGHQFTIKEDE